jgi:hypothetical protein
MLREERKSEIGKTSPPRIDEVLPGTINRIKEDALMEAIIRTRYGSPDVLQLKE